MSTTPEEERKELPVLKVCDKNPQFGTEPGDGALTIGDKRGDLVERLQFMLKDLGFALGETGLNNDGIDGNFGNLTKKAVKDFQETHKHVDKSPLKPDGMVGPRTADALNRAMVGLWFEEYQTPKELVGGKLFVTVTPERFSKGMLVRPHPSKPDNASIQQNVVRQKRTDERSFAFVILVSTLKPVTDNFAMNIKDSNLDPVGSGVFRFNFDFNSTKQASTDEIGILELPRKEGTLSLVGKESAELEVS